MAFSEVMGVAAGLFASADIIFYILAIFGRDYRSGKLPVRTVPNRVTWFVWACIGAITAASYNALGATETLWFPLAYAFGFFLIALLSLKYGEGGFSLLDAVCLLGAIISAWAWWRFNSPEIALFATIAMDAFGAVPTIKKSWYEPLKEDRFAWSQSVLASFSNVLAINWDTATFAIAAYPLYVMAVTGLITVLLYRERRHAPRSGRAS